MMKFSDLVDITELKDLCESFTAATGAATALLELDGSILVATGWQDICTQFHRVNPDTAARCRESDTVLANRLKEGEQYNLYRCRNGLVDVAVPVYAGGEHVANFFAGQFFLAPPDREQFMRQAEESGLDVQAYLRALAKVPVYSEDEVRRLMDFLSRLARMMGEMGLTRLRLEKTNRDLIANQEKLEAEIEERERTATRLREREQQLTINEMRLRQSQSIAHIASWEYDIATNRIWGSDEAFRLYGFSPSPDGALPLEVVEACASDRGKVRTALMNLIEKDIPYDIEIVVNPADGSSQKHVWSAAGLIRDAQGRPARVIGVVQDITQQKEAERGLRDSVAFLNSLIDQSPISTAITDDQGTLIRINRPGCELLSLDESEVIGRYNVLSDNHVEEQGHLPLVRSVFSEGKEVHFELAYDTSRVKNLVLEKKTSVILDVTIFPIRDSQGSITNAVIQHVDITRRRQAEEEIRRSEERFRTLVEQSPVSIQVFAPDGQILSINNACTEMWGIKPDKIAGYNILRDEQLRHLGLMPAIEQGFAGVIMEIPPALYNARDSLGSGVKRWVRSRIYPIRDHGGLIYSLIVMQEDITTQMEALDALKESESRYRRIVETANEGIWSIDAQQVTTFVNQKISEMLGYRTEEIIGKPVTDFIFPEDHAETGVQMALRQKGQNSVYESRFRRSDGSIRWMKISATAIVDDTGAYAGAFAMLFDITDRKMAEESLLRKNEELAAATEEMMAIDEELRQNYEELRKIQDAFSLARRKLNLLNQVTFEDLQSGIFSLSAYLELAGGTASQEGSQIRYAERQKSILGTLTKTLAFARNFQGLGMTPPKWQNVNQVFLYAISHMDTLSLVRNVSLDTLEIHADPLLERVFHILTENVLKWSNGATEIRVHYQEYEDHLTLVFEDNGQGIPPERKDGIFEREQKQVHGLGLYLAREILSITGISIRENGEPGNGARFEMVVPATEFRFGSGNSSAERTEPAM